jgi:hypothetical protein
MNYDSNLVRFFIWASLLPDILTSPSFFAAGVQADPAPGRDSGW